MSNQNTHPCEQWGWKEPRGIRVHKSSLHSLWWGQFGALVKSQKEQLHKLLKLVNLELGPGTL